MTTSVIVQARCRSDQLVKVDLLDISEGVVDRSEYLEDGEEERYVIHGDRAISISEVDRPTEQG